MSGFEVTPAELDGAAASLRGMGREAAFLGGGGHGAVGCGGLSSALEGFCARAHGAAGELHRAAGAVAGGYVAGAAGYEATDRSVMPGRG